MLFVFLTQARERHNEAKLSLARAHREQDQLAWSLAASDAALVQLLLPLTAPGSGGGGGGGAGSVGVATGVTIPAALGGGAGSGSAGGRRGEVSYAEVAAAATAAATATEVAAIIIPTTAPPSSAGAAARGAAPAFLPPVPGAGRTGQTGAAAVSLDRQMELQLSALADLAGQLREKYESVTLPASAQGGRGGV